MHVIFRLLRFHMKETIFHTSNHPLHFTNKIRESGEGERGNKETCTKSHFVRQLNTHLDGKYIEAQRLTDDHKNQIFNKMPIMFYLLLQKKVLLNERCVRRMARWLLQRDCYSTCVITDLKEKGGRGTSVLNQTTELFQKS